ncbi:MAG TPA: AMP-binding protein [Acidimicrobiales bacterium]|nr:AMP-binding protein [Acidimicrobiales bacterium]
MTPPAGVFDVLEGPLRDSPGHPAVVTRRATLTYAELNDLADRAAGALHGFGIRPGDRVAASMPNDLDIVAAFHGAMRLGAVWVGINRALAAPEKLFMLDDCGPKLYLVDDTEDPGDGFAELRAKLDGRVNIAGVGAWRDGVATSSGRPDLPSPDPSAPAGIAYTSGTTGFPKGAVHCQAALLMPGAATVARRGWDGRLRKGDSLPLTILNMMALTTLLTSQAGGTAVIIDQPDVSSVVRWIREQQVTVWNGPPAQLHTMVHDPSISAGDLSTLSEVWVGGGDCRDSLRAGFEERFGVPVSRTYGLTEAPALVSLDDLDGPKPSGTSGRPLDHITVRSEEGELLLSPTQHGPWAGRYRPMLGYWNRPEASAESLAGGALHTGDLGLVGQDGHLRVLGRRSQLIIRGGANVYPAEVERVLSEAPGVQACAVAGVPDERLGERVGAVIQPVPGCRLDPTEIIAHCRVQLASYKVPERMAFVDQLPRNQMGKVPRAAVTEILAGPRAFAPDERMKP